MEAGAGAGASTDVAAELLEIGVSHYCEKARWALDCSGIPYRRLTHLPFMTRFAGRSRGVWSTVPVLFTAEGPVLESTPILIWADRQRPSAQLFGASAEERSEIVQWLKVLDRELGPATRRIIYYHILSRPEIADPLLLAGVPPLEATLGRPLLPLIRKMIGKGLRIDREGATRSALKLEEVWKKVEDTLKNGRNFLSGSAFSAADLSFAALASPVLLPPNYGVPLPPLEALPPAARADIARWRDSRAGQFALDIYARYRQAGLPHGSIISASS